MLWRDVFGLFESEQAIDLIYTNFRIKIDNDVAFKENPSNQRSGIISPAESIDRFSHYNHIGSLSSVVFITRCIKDDIRRADAPRTIVSYSVLFCYCLIRRQYQRLVT